MYVHSLDVFESFISRAVVVVPPEWLQSVTRELGARPYREKFKVEVGGATRQDSVYAGLMGLGSEVEMVLVHDAARPFVSAGLIQRVIEKTRLYGACIPVLPIRDTVKEVHGETVRRTLDRKLLHRVQTPQGFAYPLLEQAFREARNKGFQGTDEATLVERLGERVYVTAGEQENVKITWKEDVGSFREEKSNAD